MSPRGNTVDAINNIYDVLRWAETRKDVKVVLIANIQVLIEQIKDMNDADEKDEHFDALYDKIYRATSGKNA